MLRESIVPSVRLSVQVIHSGIPFMHSKMATTNTSRTVKSKNSRSFSEHLKRKWKPWEHIRCTCAPNRFHPLSTTTSFILERTRSEYAYECVCMCVCACSDHKVAVVASLFWILKDFPRMVPPLAYGLRLINCKGLLNQFATAQVLVDWKKCLWCWGYGALKKGWIHIIKSRWLWKSGPDSAWR